jgi:hypothetical protein
MELTAVELRKSMGQPGEMQYYRNMFVVHEGE